MITIAFKIPEVTGPHCEPRAKSMSYPFHVVHPSNGAILAYCDTREEAEGVSAALAEGMARLAAEDALRMSGIDLDAVFAALAQGVINIESGLTTIEAGSRVHRAMSLLCELRTAGKL